MGTVQIGGSPFDIYGESDDANTYFKAHADGAAWRAAATTDKSRALVTAARSFDRQKWVGEATDPVTPQPLAWPRKNITDRNGQAVLDSVIPPDVLEGNWEWANAILGDTDIANSVPGTNTKKTRTRNKVDVIETEIEVENFKPTIGTTARFPVAVTELIGMFLAGSDAALVFVSGTDELSQFTTADTDFGFSGVGIDGGSNS